MNMKYFDLNNMNFNLNFPPLSQTSHKSSNSTENLKNQKEDFEDLQEKEVPKNPNKPGDFENKNSGFSATNKPKQLSSKALNSNSTVFYPNEKNPNANLKENSKNVQHKNSNTEYKTMKNASRKESANKNIPEESKHFSKSLSNPPVFSKTVSESTSFEEKPNVANVNNYEETGNANPEKEDEDLIVRYILNLRDFNKREDALRELSQRREKCTYLATYLWFSFGTSAIILEEIIAVYPYLSPPQITQSMSIRIGYVIGLLQSCALDSEIRTHLIAAHIPTYLYPFLRTTEQNKQFENIRIASLSVIGALIKNEFPIGVRFLLQTDEIIAICLRMMTTQENLSKTVATFIVLKIMNEDCGLDFICNNSERFSYLITVLQSMMEESSLKKKNDQKLIKQMVRCYLRLTDDARAREILKQILLPFLKKIGSEFITDESTKKIHVQLLHNLYKSDNDSKTSSVKNKNSEELNY